MKNEEINGELPFSEFNPTLPNEWQQYKGVFATEENVKEILNTLPSLTEFDWGRDINYYMELPDCKSRLEFCFEIYENHRNNLSVFWIENPNAEKDRGVKTHMQFTFDSIRVMDRGKGFDTFVIYYQGTKIGAWHV